MDARLQASSTGPGSQAEEAAAPVLEELLEDPLEDPLEEPPDALFAGAEEVSEELAAGVEGVVEVDDPPLLVSVEELEERLSVL